jgi:hypothetical protein
MLDLMEREKFERQKKIFRISLGERVYFRKGLWKEGDFFLGC